FGFRARTARSSFSPSASLPLCRYFSTSGGSAATQRSAAPSHALSTSPSVIVRHMTVSPECRRVLTVGIPNSAAKCCEENGRRSSSTSPHTAKIWRLGRRRTRRHSALRPARVWLLELGPFGTPTPDRNRYSERIL